MQQQRSLWQDQLDSVWLPFTFSSSWCAESQASVLCADSHEVRFRCWGKRHRSMLSVTAKRMTDSLSHAAQGLDCMLYCTFSGVVAAGSAESGHAVHTKR